MSNLSVRDRSERYGSLWLATHAKDIAKAMQAYQANDTSLCTAISVRVYDRTNNVMREVTLGDILVHFQNLPQDAKCNGAGQVHLRDDMFVSGAIISTIRAVHSALQLHQ